MKRKLTIAAGVCLIVALVALSVVSCAEVTPSATRGGVVRIAYSGDAESFFPPTLVYTQSQMMGATSVESLLCYDDRGDLAPFLATGWEVADDLSSITFTLRKGVKFHDGTDFNAEAAKWSIEIYIAEGLQAYFTSVESVDVLDDYTIRCGLSDFENILFGELTYAAGMMVSPTAYQTYGQEWCEKNPVGTGPFKFVSWERDVKSVWERNDNYWQAGKPYLDGIEWVIIKDPLTALASLMRGDVDAVWGVSPKDAKFLEETGKFTLSSTQAYSLWLLGDSADPKSPFANLKVRQAACYAIDRQAIVDTILHGYGFPTDQWAKPGDPFYNPDVEGYPYNPDKARQLLVEAGYPDGFKTTINCMTMPVFKDMAVAIQAYFGEIGIDAEVEAVETGRYYGLCGAGWDGLLLLDFSRSLPDFARPVKLACISERGPFPVLASYEDIDDLALKALQAPTYEEKLELNRELAKVIIDKHCQFCFVCALDEVGVSYKEVHDLGILENVSTAREWTPQDAWIEH